MFRETEGGHRLELKRYKLCENWLNLRGGKTIFRGVNFPPQPPKNPVIHYAMSIYSTSIHKMSAFQITHT